MITINAAYLTPASIQGLPDPFQVERVPIAAIRQAQQEPIHIHFENLDQALPLVKHLIEAFNDPIKQPCRFPRLHPDSVVTF
jgi:hypothetical protein